MINLYFNWRGWRKALVLVFGRQALTRSRQVVTLAAALLMFLVFMVFVGVWWQPYIITWANLALLVILLGTCWWYWSGLKNIANWLSASLTLGIFWFSSFGLWLFFETSWQRLFYIIFFLIVSWWYLLEWQQQAQKFFTLARGAGLGPTLILGFLSILSLNITAVSLLVFLHLPIWQLFIYFYLPSLIMLATFLYVSGWNSPARFPYFLAGAVIMFEGFALTLWWPVAAIVSGLTMAGLFAILALAFVQESQGFFNRRSYIKEILIITLAIIFVLLTARWI